MLDCVTQCSVSSRLIWAVLTGPTDWVCHIGTLTQYIEEVASSCIIVTWWSGSGGIQAWSRRPAGFLRCSVTVGLVIWPVKIIPETTYNVLNGMLHSCITTVTAKLICLSNQLLPALLYTWQLRIQISVYGIIPGNVDSTEQSGCIWHKVFWSLWPPNQWWLQQISSPASLLSLSTRVVCKNVQN